MPNCDTCGKSYGFFDGSGGRCHNCRNRNLSPENHDTMKALDLRSLQAGRERQHAEALAQAAERSRLASIVLTTEGAPIGLNIQSRLGIVSAECVIGMGLLTDIFAVARDVVGGRATSVQNALKDARSTALAELRAEAFALGADAVVAVDLDYSEISGGGKSMLLLVASGTAVRLLRPATPEAPPSSL